MIRDLVNGLEVLGESLNNALILESAKALEQLNHRYEVVRQLTPKDFQEIRLKNLYKGTPFDSIIDELNVPAIAKGKQKIPTWLLPVSDKAELVKNPDEQFGDTIFCCVDDSLTEYHGDNYVWIFQNGEWGEDPVLYIPIADTTSVHALGDISVGQAINKMIDAFTLDPDFAYTWHCNIAVKAFDVIERQTGIKDAHKLSNAIATAVMQHLFNVETTFTKGGLK